MPSFLIKLKYKSQNILLQSLLGTYSHLMWVRTEDPNENIVRISTTDDLLKDSKKVLESIADDVEFDIFLKIYEYR